MNLSAYLILQELKQNFDPEFHMAVADSVTRSVLFLLPKNLQRARQLINIASIMVSSANTGKYGPNVLYYESVLEIFFDTKMIIVINYLFIPAEVSDSWYRCFDSLVGQLNSADLQREVLYKRRWKHVPRSC